MMRTDKPAMTMTSAPAIAIRQAVPRSGWTATSPTGSRIIPVNSNSVG